MNRSFLILSLALSLVVGGCDGRADRPIKPTVEPVTNKAAREPVSVDPPLESITKVAQKGFVFSGLDGFEGPSEKGIFTNSKIRATIVPAFQPGVHFDDVVKEFTDENLRQSSMSARERVMKEIGGRKTYFVKGDRLSGKSPRMFTSVIYPTVSGCAQLTAIYPSDTSAQIQESIDSSLLNSKYFDKIDANQTR